MIRYFGAAMVAFAVMAFAPAAMAMCVNYGPHLFECSGNNSASLLGTPQADIFVVKNGTTGSIGIHSGGGADVIDFSDLSGPVTVNVTAGGYIAVAPGLTIQFSGFDGLPGVTIRGGAGADTLIGGAGDDILIGGPGADALVGNGGTDRRGDTLLADCGGDTLNNIEIDSCPAAPASVPTLSEWAMILLAVLLAGGAALTINRRRTA